MIIATKEVRKIKTPEKIIMEWREKLQKTWAEHKITMLQWETTRRCDLNCKHCGSPKEKSDVSHELTTAEVIRAFTEIRNTLDLSQLRFVTLTGGEPFMRKDLLEIIALFKSFGWITTIQTNGNYLASRSKIIPKLLDLGVRGIGIDLDGTRYFHDNLRNKSGHFDQSVENIQRLLAYPNILHVSTTTVVTKENISCLPELWRMISDINPHRWRLLPLETMGRSNDSKLALSSKELRWVVDFLLAINIQNRGQKKTQAELGCIGWAGTTYEARIRPYAWSCIAGINCLGILHDGSLSACAHIDRNFIQGNVRDENIADAWKNKYQIFRQRPEQDMCRGCRKQTFCTIPMHKLGTDGKLRNCATKSL